jgi:hypothetical protein
VLDHGDTVGWAGATVGRARATGGLAGHGWMIGRGTDFRNLAEADYYRSSKKRRSRRSRWGMASPTTHLWKCSVSWWAWKAASSR